MPELPEVETVKRGLEKTIVGLKITDIKVLNEKNFQGKPKDVIGKKVVSVNRRAKIIIIAISNQLSAINYLLIHLKMTGQLIYKLETQSSKLKATTQSSKLNKFKKSPYSIGTLPNKYTRVVVSFNNGGKLYFNDLRKFGWMRLVKLKTQNSKLKADFDEIIGEKYGPEPLEKEFTTDYLKEVLTRWGRPVKFLLMDQSKIAGIGNIYANEALFCARIAPHHCGRDLTKDHPEKIEKLYKCIKEILKKAIEYGGSTASDDAFRNIKGEPGKMQQYLHIYGRAGEKCPTCGGTIRKMKLGGRGTFFCPACQH